MYTYNIISYIFYTMYKIHRRGIVFIYNNMIYIFLYRNGIILFELFCMVIFIILSTNISVYIS